MTALPDPAGAFSAESSSWGQPAHGLLLRLPVLSSIAHGSAAVQELSDALSGI